MKWSITVISVMILSLNVVSQISLDTIKVYNVNCTYTEGNSVISWGGNWTEYFPSIPCPSDSLNIYLENYQIVQKYLDNRDFFWIRLYDTNNVLLYEGMKFADCKVGSFICYWPNGQIKLRGQYSGYKYANKKGYVIKHCKGKKIGDWIEYDINGIIIEKTSYK